MGRTLRDPNDARPVIEVVLTKAVGAGQGPCPAATMTVSSPRLALQRDEAPPAAALVKNRNRRSLVMNVGNSD